MSCLPTPQIRSRQIADADVGGVIDLLATGFPLRSRAYWERALAALTSRPTPAGFAKYGYVLECDRRLIGVILLIFSTIPGGASVTTRCNVSSWYVDPAFRSHAALLIAQALKHKNVTYINISPAMHTRPIVEAQGYSQYSNGQFVCAPLLSPRPNEPVTIVDGNDDPNAHFAKAEGDLLREHKRYGCVSLWCVESGRAYPFVFMPRRVKRVIPCAQLIYCRSLDDFARFARPLGRELLRRGRPFVIVDTNGPIPGLAGRYFDGKSPKYFRGPDRPTFGDLAYTEAVMFGL